MKFNPDLIQKARKGEIAILNDGSVDELIAILKQVWPNDVTPYRLQQLSYSFYQAKASGGLEWRSRNSPPETPTASVKEFYMIDTKEFTLLQKTDTVTATGTEAITQPRTYKVTRGQMKGIYEAIDAEYKGYFIEIMERQFGHFDNEGLLYNGHIESLCEAAPKELLQKIFPTYFFIPEGEPVLCKDNLGHWIVGVSDGKGKAYVSFSYKEAQSYDQIIPFTKNPPK